LSSSSKQNSNKWRTNKVHFASHLFISNCCFQLREHKQKLLIAY